MVQLLINHGAKVNGEEYEPHSCGVTPRAWAILFGQTEIAKLLKKHGGTIYTREFLNRTFSELTPALVVIPQPTSEEVNEYAKARGKRLSSLREKQTLSRQWVAKQLGVSSKTIEKWELGTSQPTMKQLVHLAAIYDVSPSKVT